jgi:hypothetical protein
MYSFIAWMTWSAMENINQCHIQSTLAPFTMSNQLPTGAFLANAKMHLKWKNEEMKMSIEDFALKKENIINTTVWQQVWHPQQWILKKKKLEKPCKLLRVWSIAWKP